MTIDTTVAVEKNNIESMDLPELNKYILYTFTKGYLNKDADFEQQRKANNKAIKYFEKKSAQTYRQKGPIELVNDQGDSITYYVTKTQVQNKMGKFIIGLSRSDAENAPAETYISLHQEKPNPVQFSYPMSEELRKEQMRLKHRSFLACKEMLWPNTFSLRSYEADSN